LDAAGSAAVKRPRNFGPNFVDNWHWQPDIAPMETFLSGKDQSPSALSEDARWIWAPGAGGANSYAEFQCCFRIGGPITEAWIQLSAETSFRLWVNGRLLLSGPLREVPPYFYFDSLDLRPFLRQEDNELTILAHHQGQNSQSYQAGTPAILVAGRCVADSVRVADFAKAENWKARRAVRYRAQAHRLFSCLGFSEDMDFDVEEAEWKNAMEVAVHPWKERPLALTRDLPWPREVLRRPAAQARQDDGWLIDMGVEVSGYIELELESAKPVSLRLDYAEELSGGKVDSGKGGMEYFDRLRWRGGRIKWRSYEKRAFRYLHIDAPVDLGSVRVAEQNYPYEAVYQGTAGYRAREACEDGRLINRILDVSARSIELNTEDLLTDCPWRERAQYLDGFFYMGVMRRLFGTLAPYKRFLRQFARGADASGLLRMCYPSPKGTSVIPDFSISYSFLLRQYLEESGDLETVRDNLRFARRGIEALGAYEDAGGLLADVPGWIFLDNTFELPKYPRSSGLNAVYYGGHRAVAFLLKACGQALQAGEYEAKAARIREAYRRTFLRDGRLLDSDSTPSHELFRQWVYHYSAETGRWKGQSFRMRLFFRLPKPGCSLRLSVHGGARAWIDGAPVAQIREGGSWIRSALYQGTELTTPDDDCQHCLDLEIEWSGIDWECYLSSLGDVIWSEAIIWEEDQFGRCLPDAEPPGSAFTSRLRHHSWPWMTQISVGYAAWNGLLEDQEAKELLSACLPAQYNFPFAKRTTPFFAVIDDRIDPRRILPCNVAASMFYFCHALKKYGMEREARNLLLPIYQGMLERGATAWWEEWNTRSSLCHAWGSFVADFLGD